MRIAIDLVRHWSCAVKNRNPILEGVGELLLRKLKTKSAAL